MGNSTRSTENRATVLLISRHLPDALEGDRGLRLLQYAQNLTRIGTKIDMLICPDHEIDDVEVRRCRARVECDRIVALEPTSADGRGAWLQRLAMSLPAFVGKKLAAMLKTPLSWRRAARQLLRETRYHAIIVLDPGLAGLCKTSSASSVHLLDLVDLGLEKNRSDGPRRQANLQETLDHIHLFDRIMAPTGLDANLWERMGQGVPLTVLPYVGTGPGLSHQRPPSRPPGILLLASRDPEDQDAMRFFRKKVFPKIQERVPSTRLRIFSPEIDLLDPAPNVDLFDAPGVVEELFQESWVCVFPQRTGMRARSWLAEALCRGKAVVATPSGAYGMGIAPDNGVVVAKSPQEFHEEVVRVLTDDAHREKLETRAQEWTTNDLRPEQASKTLAEILALTPTITKRAALREKLTSPKSTASTGESETELAGSGSHME